MERVRMIMAEEHAPDTLIKMWENISQIIDGILEE